MLNSGSKIKNYKIVVELKIGSQGFVYVADDEITHERCVLKSIYVEETKKEEFEKTIGTWNSLQKSDGKDYIVKYKEHFQEGKNMIIIMEFCPGGDLDTLIKKRMVTEGKFTEQEVLKVLIEMMRALKEMRVLKFIHRDVKSANILIGADGKYKMSDFNTARVLEGSRGASTLTGTLEYTAAEIAKSEEYSYEVDVWSLGAVLYQMMTFRTPFVNSRGLNIVNLAMGKYEPLSPALGYSQNLVDLVHRCLLLDRTQRPTPADVLASPLAAKAHIVRLEAQVERLDADNAGLQRRVAAAEKEAATARQEAKEARQEAMEAKDEAKEALQKVRNMEAMEGLVAQLRRDITALQTQLFCSSQNESLSVINGWLGGLETFKLLYRATDDGFDAAVFHLKCNSKGPTVAIFASAEDYVFGGYTHTPVSWTKDPGYVGDDSKQSFLFSLKSPRKEPPMKFGLNDYTRAIYSSPNTGPCFGDDIYCHANRGSLDASLGRTYLNTTGLDSKTIFTGKYKNTPKEIEVYQVL